MFWNVTSYVNGRLFRFDLNIILCKKLRIVSYFALDPGIDVLHNCAYMGLETI